ncbi:MAG TPA: O-antigen ligase family protein, partial [Elusimicrobiales bacterium]|nr:O-antigen ligase family protein [Elusimicrobiales bacterium]
MEKLLILSLVFAPLAFAAVEPWALALLQLAAFASVYRLFRDRVSLYPAALYRNLLPALLAVALIGLLQALRENPVNAPSALIFTVWRPATLNAILLWLFYAAVVFVVPQIIRAPEQFKRLMWTVFGMGVLLSLFGMFQASGENALIYGARYVKGEPFGPFINRDHAATFLIMSAMAGCGVFVSGFRDMLSGRSRRRFFDLAAIQLLKSVMLCAVVYGVVRTGSRGGLHSLVCAFSLMAFVSASFLRDRTARLAARSGLVFFLAVYGLILYNNRLLLGYAEGDLVRSVTVRFSMYRSGLEMLRDFPLFGVGLGAVEHAFHAYRYSDIPSWGFVRHLHSDWLELFVQSGLVGGLIYLAGFALALSGLARVWLNCPSFTVKSLYGGALGAVLAASLHNLVEFGSQMPANALVFYVLIGALASKPAAEPRKFRYDAEDEEEGGIRIRKNIALPLAAASALLAVFTIPSVVAWARDAYAKNASYAERVKSHAAALAWDPSPRYAFRLGADHYNAALKNKAEARALFTKSLDAITPVLLRNPVNSDLQKIRKNIFYHLSALPPAPRLPDSRPRTP